MVVACAATTAHAQIAVAPLLQADNAPQRDIAAGIVTAVASQRAMLTPALTVADIKGCGDDVSCLMGVAKAHHATHLMVVAVAQLGARDQVMVLQLFAVQSGAKLFEKSAVASTTTDVRHVATALGDAAAFIDGPARAPVAAAAVVPPAPVARYVAIGLLASGAAVAVGTFGIATALFSTPDSGSPNFVLAPAVIGVGGVLAAGLVVGGLGALVFDRVVPDTASASTSQ